MAESGEGVNIASLPIPQLQEIAKQHEQKVQFLNTSMQQLRGLQSQFAASRECLKQFHPENKDKNILVPLTSTLCVPGKLIDPTKALVDIGTGYFAEMVCSTANFIKPCRKLKVRRNTLPRRSILLKNKSKRLLRSLYKNPKSTKLFQVFSRRKCKLP